MDKEEARRLKQLEDDRALIEREGGPAVLAKKLMLKGKFARERVQNWTWRGIPASIKLQYPEVFLKNVKRGRK